MALRDKISPLSNTGGNHTERLFSQAPLAPKTLTQLYEDEEDVMDRDFVDYVGKHDVVVSTLIPLDRWKL